jgi:N-acetylglucosaminyl-diphospho-decaprenol L-rhamnosyltransferase
VTITVGAIIVAYRSSKHVADCVTPLLEDPSISRIVVIDNSHEVACRRIIEEFSAPDRITYVAPENNLGYGRACNLAATLLPDVDQYLVLNPDVCLTSPLAPLLELNASGRYSIVTASLGSLDNALPANIRQAVTIRREFLKAIRGGRHYFYSRRAIRDQDGLLMPEQADGAFLLVRRDLFDDLGGFDESFELYYEDVDFCARALRNAPIACHPHQWGTHVGGASFEASGKSAAFTTLRVSRIRYLRKSSPGSRTLTWLLGLLALVEFTARTIGRLPEGAAARRLALSAQFKELRHAGSTRSLQQPS